MSTNLKELEKTITNYIREGEAYSDDYIRTCFAVSGVFQNDDDQFDSARMRYWSVC